MYFLLSFLFSKVLQVISQPMPVLIAMVSFIFRNFISLTILRSLPLFLPLHLWRPNFSFKGRSSYIFFSVVATFDSTSFLLTMVRFWNPWSSFRRLVKVNYIWFRDVFVWNGTKLFERDCKIKLTWFASSMGHHLL